MNLVRLDLQDVGRFGVFSCGLAGQLVGVVGSNGAGKSTILSAVHYAVTGDLSRLGSRDAVAVVRGKPDAQPFVRLTVRPAADAADEAVFLRKLPADGKDGARRLAHAGRVWSAQSDLAAQVERWTGLSPKTLTDFVFVAQGELDAVVTDQPARRAEVLQRLFGVDAAARAYAAAGEHLTGLPVAPETAVVDALRARAAEARAAADEVYRDRELVLPTEAAMRESGRHYDDIVRRYQDTVKYLADVAAADNRISAIEAKIARPKAPRPDAAYVAELETAVAAWDAHNKAVKAARDAAQTAATLAFAATQAEAAIGPEPVEPVEPDEVAAIGCRLYALKVVIGAPTNTPAICPVCYGPLSPDLSDRELARVAIDTHQAATTKHAAAFKAYRTLLQARAVAVGRADTLRRQAEAAARESGRVAAACPPRPDIEEVSVHRLMAAAVAQIRAADADDKEVMYAYQGMAAAQAARRAIEPVRGGQATAEQATNAREAKESLWLSFTSLSNVKARADALAEAAEAAEAAVERAEAQARAADWAAAWRARVERVRGYLHRDAGPAAAARACLEDLTADLNNRLGHLGARYRVAVDPAGQLTAEYRDGTTTSKVPAYRISGGERAVLGLAWRLALLDRYAPKVGVLCLDEPTTGLDRDRVDRLRSALEAWRPHGSDRQFIIVTHERRLLSVFDTVVDLG